jgi:hypothetical protein
MSITSKARTAKLLLAMSPALLAVPGCARGSSDASSEEDDDGATTPPTGLTVQDIEQATYLDLEPGVPWEMDVGNNAATYAAGPEAALLMLETISAKSWATIHTGESRTVSFELGSGESLAAYARPYDEAGNVDLKLY